MLDANATVEWTPDVHGQAHGRLAAQHGRLEHLAPPLLRAAAAVLPLRVRAPERDRLAGRAARSARSAGSTSSRSCAGPWIDEVPIRCEACGEEVRRIPEVGDVWLDAGIVPFSTLGWQNPEWVPEGYATGRRQRADRRRPPRPRVLGEVVPGRLGLGDARADPALVLLAALHVGRARSGRAPYRRVLGYEKMLDETGREMHGSWGNMIDAEDAFERMGADVMRWQYCAQPPDQNLLFGFGPGARDQAEAAHALELGRVPRRLREHRGLPARRTATSTPAGASCAARPLARRADAAARRRGDRRRTSAA